MTFSLADLVGMIGTLLVVLAYFLLQLERMDARSLGYNALNLVGAVLLLISLLVNFNLASFVIELFWIAASVIGLWRWFQRSRELA